jgi:hypothetical protein
MTTRQFAQATWYGIVLVCAMPVVVSPSKENASSNAINLRRALGICTPRNAAFSQATLGRPTSLQSLPCVTEGNLGRPDSPGFGVSYSALSPASPRKL